MVDISFIFTFIYSLGNVVGKIVAFAALMTSGVVLPDEIINTVGLLTIVTALLVLADIAKKFAWGIVTLCWGLIIMKIGLLMFNNG